MEMLKSSNWMHRRMFGVLRQLGLDKYIATNEKVPAVAKEGQPTEENEAQRKWSERGARDSI